MNVQMSPERPAIKTLARNYDTLRQAAQDVVAGVEVMDDLSRQLIERLRRILEHTEL